MSVERSVERLARVLVLVPWVIRHPGCTVGEVCERFGMTRAELASDLDMLFVCGLPPFGPGDLIVAFIEDDQVVIDMADYLRAPPRLTRAEAATLLITGRAVAALPADEADSLRSALVKLERAIAPDDVESAHETASRVEVELSGQVGEVLGDLRAAIGDRARIRMTYYSQGRSQMTEREVDPLLLFGAGGYWYLAGVDHLRDDVRTFRVDRIREAVRTGVTFEAPGDFEPARYSAGSLFTPSPRDFDVTIEVSAGAAWMLEAVPHEDARAIEGGRTRMRLRTPHLAWLVRLLLSAGPDARAVDPAELVAAVKEGAARALARYEAFDV